MVLPNVRLKLTVHYFLLTIAQACVLFARHVKHAAQLVARLKSSAKVLDSIEAGGKVSIQKTYANAQQVMCKREMCATPRAITARQNVYRLLFHAIHQLVLKTYAQHQVELLEHNCVVKLLMNFRTPV